MSSTGASIQAPTADDAPSDADDEGPPVKRHKLAQRGDWPWLPTQGCGHLAPHPYCEDCGQVKAVGTGRAMDLGGLVNLLADLRRVLDREGLKLTAVQRRLILQALQEKEIDDPFGLSRDRQMEIVTQVASRYTGIHEQAMATYLRSC